MEKEQNYEVTVIETTMKALTVRVKAKDYNNAAVKAMQMTEGMDFKKIVGKEYNCTDMNIIDD